MSISQINNRNGKKLKIAMFFSSDPASPGGVQEHVYYLAQSLKALGHTVTVFTVDRKDILLPYPNLKRIGEFTEISTPLGYDLSFVNKKENENYKEIFTSKKFDLLHIHDPFMPFLSYELLNVVDLPIVTTYHATWEKDSILDAFSGFIPLFKHILSKKVKGSIFVSQRTKKCWDEIFHNNTRKAVIDNGIDRKLFSFNKKKTGRIINLLFLARIVPKKGLHVLLKALKTILVNNKDIHLSVVGEGPDRKRMMDYVKENKMEKYVSFHGYVKKEDKPKHYQTADIFCAPYINEGFGITLLEAMATGTPIVALKNNAFSEVLKEYPVKSLIVDRKDPKVMAHAIERLIYDAKLRQKIVKWEMKEIKKYDWAKVGKETQDFYYQVLKK
jgi:phosphatidylinositol alpha-mannosyltransferase